ncbi:tryptophan 2,3-dioxygenase [Peribacillus sp. NPDC097295]|uniref:tryptophan 2,3-dioxygenase n=1 Tax=Peribacillus sp. NPDC097295 TaxID=3364402 RepID=UPI0037FC1034
MDKESMEENRLEEGMVTDFEKEMSYGDYLQLDQVLSSQRLLSGHHDEMLFIVIHQTSELWMKLILHEMTAATGLITEGRLEPSFKMLSRISRIQQQLVHSWNVLSTLTPSDYMEFRDKLGNSSGFQSFQNRMIECAMGQKNKRILAVFRHQPALYESMLASLNKPSIYDAAIGALAARGFSIDESILNRDWSEPYRENESVEEAWLAVYRDVHQYWDLYELAEKLVDIGSQQQFWRFNHMSTVERIIGQRMGTGGSTGVNYLKKVVDQPFFPELWTLRTKL